MANIVLQDSNFISHTFENVSEIILPTEDGGTQRFSIGGGDTVYVKRLRSYTPTIDFSESSPSKESDLDRLVCVATYTVPAGQRVQDVSYIGQLCGYVTVNGGPASYVPTDWNEYGSVVQTPNQDGTTTVTVTFTPRNNSIYKYVFNQGLKVGYTNAYLNAIITTIE